MRQKLTKTELELFRFYREYRRDFGAYPTRLEVRLALDHSDCNLSFHLKNIKAKGYLKDVKTKSRKHSTMDMIQIQSARYSRNVDLYTELFTKQADYYDFDYRAFLQDRGYTITFTEMLHPVEVNRIVQEAKVYYMNPIQRAWFNLKKLFN